MFLFNVWKCYVGYLIFINYIDVFSYIFVKHVCILICMVFVFIFIYWRRLYPIGLHDLKINNKKNYI